MELGMFIPIANNGWLVSTTAPKMEPTWDLNLSLVQRAERYGFEFALSMVRFRGCGGQSQFWDHSLESFTLMAALAARTERIRLYASTAILTLHPAVVAKMAVTIDAIAPGRFGINIVTGWQRTEFTGLGMWPGDEHYARRYDLATEYVSVVRQLWDGVSDFKGEYYQLEAAPALPTPSGGIQVVCAGQSDRGIQFCAEYGDVNFVVNTGVNTPTSHRSTNERVLAAAERTGRSIGTYVLCMVIADETDEAAFARWRRYQSGIDMTALAYMSGQSTVDPKSIPAGSSTELMARAETDAAVTMGMGTLIGSYERVAELLDEMAEVPGTRGIMLTFDDFSPQIDAFAERVQPLMSSRTDARLTAS